jgi:biopolymer transport protein ExbD
MAMSVGTGGATKAEINVTPLIDVVLVLLIIFMVITPLVQMGYDLQIPRKAENVEINYTPTDQVILSVVQDSAIVRVYINKEEVPKDQLGARLGAIFKNKPDKLMFLSADRKVNYGELMTIVDIARSAGGDSLKIGLVTEDKMSVGPGSGA